MRGRRHEGLLLLSALAERAGSLDLGRMIPAAESLSYAGPRGEVEIEMHHRHLAQRVYLAQADVSSSTSSPGSDGGLAR